jgi:hypothetical protein
MAWIDFESVLAFLLGLWLIKKTVNEWQLSRMGAWSPRRTLFLGFAWTMVVGFFHAKLPFGT